MSSLERLDPPTHRELGTVNQILPAQQIGIQCFKHYEVPGLDLNTDPFCFRYLPLKNELGSF